VKFVTTRSFEKDVDAVRDKKLLQRLAALIEQIRLAPSTAALPSMVALSGFSGVYRFRVGDYRLGCHLDGDTLVLARFLNRKEIYRKFP
jgi:mRNA interferase RelE/StbE